MHWRITAGSSSNYKHTGIILLQSNKEVNENKCNNTNCTEFQICRKHVRDLLEFSTSNKSSHLESINFNCPTLIHQTRHPLHPQAQKNTKGNEIDFYVGSPSHSARHILFVLKVSLQ